MPIAAAQASVYALIVHCRLARLASRSRWRVGNAVTTTRASRATMKKATEVSAIVQRGCEVRVAMPSQTLAAVKT